MSGTTCADENSMLPSLHVKRENPDLDTQATFGSRESEDENTQNEEEFSFEIRLGNNLKNIKKDEIITVPDYLKEKFHCDGFIVIPNVLDQETVSTLNCELENILRGQYDTGRIPDKAPKIIKGQLKEHGGTIGPLGFSGNFQNVKVLQIINVHKCNSMFHEVATNPILGQIVAKLAGWTLEGIRLAQDQIWAKPPGAAPLVFHRDSPYFMFDPPHVVTVWIALDDMDATLGPLEYVVGSHLWGDGRSGSANQFFQPNQGGKTLLYSAAEREGKQIEDLAIVSMEGLQAGGISIHCGRTWHGSGKNESRSRPRRGLGLHFVPAEVKFTPDACKSSLWRSYVEGFDDASKVPLSEDDFPITWKPPEKRDLTK